MKCSVTFSQIVFFFFFCQVLKFNGWYKQTVHESPSEHYRIRPVSIFYYLEDNSISVVEPHVENSGMPQGKNRMQTGYKRYLSFL